MAYCIIYSILVNSSDVTQPDLVFFYYDLEDAVNEPRGLLAMLLLPLYM